MGQKTRTQAAAGRGGARRRKGRGGAAEQSGGQTITLKKERERHRLTLVHSGISRLGVGGGGSGWGEWGGEGGSGWRDLEQITSF